ncbi:sugar ABC transporter substrate-binding protein [Aquibacillus sp. 3ASR75-11]|uniref:Sugar ABC transporter substrate-binding protein n=1 Tax=Terrihalobacillus insolitus TaxID=2950438 RepID=A0A9X4ANH4_9BACI|nr:sugar ABC transporter substrate-binding protein [Terrihalobacillus insolitus]MDC3413813.1 sugar ABC transporter substrate-binding protein [Terrihalobacillus insolitus]MDC3424540.1 sugar ABC transporter substrate-binding protein [Terrihalobacillus insolitus]
MMNAKFLLMLVLGMMLITFTACSDGDETSAGDTEDTTTNEENTDNTGDNTGDTADTSGSSDELSGEVEFMTISLLPAFEDYLNGLKESFESEHPGVTVKINDVPYDQVEQLVLTKAASGDLPDVMNLNTDFVKKAGAKGALVNMDEAAADVKDTFFEGIWEAGSVNGSVYALPWYTTTSGLIYNPELLEKAGYDAPPATFEEAWEMSPTILEKTGAYGEVIMPEMHFQFPKNGIPFLNEDNTKAAFNTPEAVELWTKYKEYYDEGLYDIDILLNQVSMAELYAQEKVAWWYTGPQLFRQVKDLSPDVYEKSLAGPPLEGTAGKQHANPMNIAVSSTSKSKDAAVAFAKFVTNADNQLAFAKEAAVLPPVKEAIEDPFFAEGEDSEDATERGKFYAAQALDTAENMIPPVESVSGIYEAIHQAFQRVLLQDVDPADALTQAEQEVNSLLAE